MSSIARFYYKKAISSLLIYFAFQVWFQNRRAKFRKQERLAQQKASSNNSSESPGSQSSIKAENNATSKTSSLVGKDVKPGSPHSGISTTPNSNASVSSHQSSNGDVKPMNGNGKFHIKYINNNPLYFIIFFEKKRASLSDRTILFLYAEDKSMEHLAGITYARYSFPVAGVGEERGRRDSRRHSDI